MRRPSLSELTRALPAGTGDVTLALAVNAVATYGFLAISSSQLNESDYDALAVVWAITYIVGPGLFQPVEQELSRAISHAAVVRADAAAVIARGAVIAVGLSAAVSMLFVVTWPLQLRELLGSSALLLALIIAVVGFAASEVTRGVLAGRSRFRGYAIYIAAEGLVRLALLLVVLASGSEGAVTISLCFAVGFGVSSALAWWSARPPIRRPIRRPGSAAPIVETPDVEADGYGSLSSRLVVLLVSSLGEAFVLNIGPVAIALLVDDTGSSGAYLNALVIARIPVFLFQAVKAALLPNLTDLAARGATAELSGVLRSVIVKVSALLSFGIVAAVVFGPLAVDVMFGTRPRALDMGLLAAATGGLMLSITLTVALVALDRAPTAARGWVVGVVVFFAAVVPGDDPRTRVGIALVLMVSAAVAYMAVSVRRALRQPA